MKPVSGTDGIFLIDTCMFGQSGFTAAYLFRSDRTVLVDAGLYQDGPTVEDDLREAGVGPGELDYLVVSHLHLDHAGGITYLAERYPEAQILGHPITLDYLSDSKKMSRLFDSGQKVMSAFSEGYDEAEALEPDRLEVLEDGTKIDLGELRLQVLHAPGHAPHQICFYEETNEALHLVDEGCALLDGDLYPTTPPPDFDLEKTLQSLNRFIELAPQVLLYSHFGYLNGGQAVLNEHKNLLQYWVDLIDGYRTSDRSRSEVVEEVVEDFASEAPGEFLEILKRDVRGVYEYLERNEPITSN